MASNFIAHPMATGSEPGLEHKVYYGTIPEEERKGYRLNAIPEEEQKGYRIYARPKENQNEYRLDATKVNDQQRARLVKKNQRSNHNMPISGDVIILSKRNDDATALTIDDGFSVCCNDLHVKNFFEVMESTLATLFEGGTESKPRSRKTLTQPNRLSSSLPQGRTEGSKSGSKRTSGSKSGSYRMSGSKSGSHRTARSKSDSHRQAPSRVRDLSFSDELSPHNNIPAPYLLQRNVPIHGKAQLVPEESPRLQNLPTKCMQGNSQLHSMGMENRSVQQMVHRLPQDGFDKQLLQVPAVPQEYGFRGLDTKPEEPQNKAETIAVIQSMNAFQRLQKLSDPFLFGMRSKKKKSSTSEDNFELDEALEGPAKAAELSPEFGLLQNPPHHVSGDVYPIIQMSRTPSPTENISPNFDRQLHRSSPHFMNKLHQQHQVTSLASRNTKNRNESQPSGLFVKKDSGSHQSGLLRNSSYHVPGMRQTSRTPSPTENIAPNFDGKLHRNSPLFMNKLPQPHQVTSLANKDSKNRNESQSNRHFGKNDSGSHRCGRRSASPSVSSMFTHSSQRAAKGRANRPYGKTECGSQRSRRRVTPSVKSNVSRKCQKVTRRQPTPIQRKTESRSIKTAGTSKYPKTIKTGLNLTSDPKNGTRSPMWSTTNKEKKDDMSALTADVSHVLLPSSTRQGCYHELPKQNQRSTPVSWRHDPRLMAKLHESSDGAGPYHQGGYSDESASSHRTRESYGSQSSSTSSSSTGVRRPPGELVKRVRDRDQATKRHLWDIMSGAEHGNVQEVTSEDASDCAQSTYSIDSLMQPKRYREEPF